MRCFTFFNVIILVIVYQKLLILLIPSLKFVELKLSVIDFKNKLRLILRLQIWPREPFNVTV